MTSQIIIDHTRDVIDKFNRRIFRLKDTQRIPLPEFGHCFALKHRIQKMMDHELRFGRWFASTDQIENILAMTQSIQYYIDCHYGDVSPITTQFEDECINDE